VSKYILRRAVLMLPVLLGVSIVTFALLRLVPGDPVIVIVGPDARLSQEQVDHIRELYGLSQPVPVQYGHWLGRVLQGDLGTSIRSGRTLVDELGLRLPVTLELTVLAAIIGTLPALLVGILAAVRRGTAADFIATLATLIWISVPGFFLATLLVLVFSIWLRWLPPIGFISFFQDPAGNLRTMFLPALSLGLPLSAILMRMTRSSVLEVLGQDHVRVARAKGLGTFQVMARHVVPNAAIPIITLGGIQIARLLGGVVIVETIFGLPGMGRYVVDAIGNRDYPVVQGVTLVVAALTVLVSLVVDVLYTVVDPRQRTA
jgi:peptide/nickel transport system permease protein